MHCDNITISPSIEVGTVKGNVRISQETNLCVVDCDTTPKTILYAGPVATGTGDGSSWENTALFNPALLGAGSTSDKEVWVKQGTYMGTFTLTQRCFLFGGFLGVETKRSQRNSNPLTNNTIIIGGPPNTPCFIVPVSALSITTAVLDGFTLRDGVSTTAFRAGGLNLSLPSAGQVSRFTIRNARIVNCQNMSVNGIGAVAVVGGINVALSTVLEMCNVIIEDNVGSICGGVRCDNFTELTGNNIIFKNNLSTANGGAISANASSRIVVMNGLFVDNVALNGFGAAVNLSGSTTVPVALVNCTFYGNSNPNNSNGVVFSNRSTTAGNVFNIRNCIFWNNNSSGITKDVTRMAGASMSVIVANSIVTSTSGIITLVNNLSSDPMFVNAPSDLRLLPSSPAINFGNNAFLTTVPVTFTVPQDLDGNMRIVNNIVDLGPYEFGDFPLPVYSFCALFKNCEGDIDSVKIKLDFENAVLNTESCDFNILAFPLTLSASSGPPVNNSLNNTLTWYNGGLDPAKIPYTSIFTRPFRWHAGEMNVCVSFIIRNTLKASILYPIWSFTGYAKGCIPIHISSVSSIDCLPQDVYNP
jgi:hypothetical protein